MEPAKVARLMEHLSPVFKPDVYTRNFGVFGNIMYRSHFFDDRARALEGLKFVLARLRFDLTQVSRLIWLFKFSFIASKYRCLLPIHRFHTTYCNNLRLVFVILNSSYSNQAVLCFLCQLYTVLALL